MNGSPPESGGVRVNFDRQLHFRFNGKTLIGYAGDTLASALVRSGLKLVGRSFKYHRPRGIVSAGAEEPCALVQLGRGALSEPNRRATQVELFEGLEAKSVNAWPSVGFDVGALNGAFAKLFVAGFYYKTFMHPRSFWMRYYEPAIRRFAGFGKAPTLPDPERYDHKHVHCDVLVAGGGPAGLAAALAAARSSARVVLADEQNEFGGQLLGRRELIGDAPALDWVGRTVDELENLSEVRLLPRTTVFGYYDHNYLCLLERRSDHLSPAQRPSQSSRHRVWHVRAKEVVLAMGAHERPLVFADNDRPGVMLAHAAQTYVNRYGARPGERAVVFTNNDSAYGAAIDLARGGVEIAAIVDVREAPPALLSAHARAHGLAVIANGAITAVEGVRAVRAAVVDTLTAGGAGIAGSPRRIACDLVLQSGGWNPAVHLHAQAQGGLDYRPEDGCFVPAHGRQQNVSVGAAKGSFALADCLAEGYAAGARAAERAGFGEGTPAPLPEVEPEPPSAPRLLWIVPSDRPLGHGRAKHFVDLQNDVTAADLRLAQREGLSSAEHVKRYTTLGMGTDQGKTSLVNGVAILSALRGESAGHVGVPTFRPPYTPVSFGALAGNERGELMDPIRVTPMHDWHVAHGALFENVGQWKRPWYYPHPGETMEAAVRRECLAVRRSVGVLDASTLGKIDIRGPDAAAFLNRVYTNRFDTLAVGRCRYGLMCRDTGMVFDDGVTTRLGEYHFHMTTTTGNAAAVLDWLEEYAQTEWPSLKVFFTSLTEQWAVVSIAGPNAPAVMAELAPGLPLDEARFPFM
ncbi:MAG TPA: 2Fe-2S iron-sulfur cluster-binding protein, partial [Alphaproteobacteria bacterium]|nr:2Fe-2S iron-sulfur cluster-binding protein [Alphaproteobacteria bacterium]